ncbi:MAG: hypothetical protein U9R02_04445 [Thermodesulfobacteriota bacterium]|nr:hypothetical protein [Thermodesulfobacteriota bacterium]
MLTPDQFRVNEAWIAVRINDEFLFVKEEPYDIYVLIDAASCYVLGNVLSRVVDEAPYDKDIHDLFNTAWQAKRQWAKTLIITENLPADEIFSKHAQQNGLSIKKVSISDLEPILGPLKESFASNFMGGNT